MSKHIGLALDSKAMSILMMIPTQEKGAPKTQKRIIRIRRNLVRELAALNKELIRHRPKVKILTDQIITII